MDFPFELPYTLDAFPDNPTHSISINGGVTVLVGPNGSGKTQILRAMKRSLSNLLTGKTVRYVSAGRLAHLENFRSDYDGRRLTPNYDDAALGSLDFRKRRHRIETVLGDFHTLSIRPDIQIKVTERLRRLFKRDLFLKWDAGILKAFFARIGANGDPYSSSREASGLLHLVALLAALYDDDVSALLIDEPEVSLHPQLQSFLLREISRAAGDPDEGKKIIVLATHSTEFVEIRGAEDLTRIAFCYDPYDAPKQISPTTEELQNRKLRALIARLGQEHKLAFFCDRPLLLEGPSDVIVCTGIDRKLDLHLEAAGSQPLPVIGKGQMPVVVKLMRLIGKAPVVVSDADGFSDNRELVHSFANLPSIIRSAQKDGHADLNSWANRVHSDFCDVVEANWEDIRGEATKHQYWTSRDDATDEVLYRRRATLSTLLSMPKVDIEELPHSKEWQAIRSRLDALLSFLEANGLFFLRRGTIESYYQQPNATMAEGKPLAAAEEVEHLAAETSAYVEANYDDPVRALRFAARTQPINEAVALRNLLLSIATPILASLSAETQDADLKHAAKDMHGENSILFEFTTVRTEGDRPPQLAISLNSNVLEVDGFPMRLAKDANPIVEIERQLGLR